MELDQILFKRFMKFIDRRFKKTPQEVVDRTIKLDKISGKLTLLARAITGKNIEIIPAEEEGGWKNAQFYLPSQISFLPSLEQNLNFYLFRIVYLSIQFEKKLNWNDIKDRKDINASRKKAMDVSDEILTILKEEYSPVYRFYEGIKLSFGEDLLPKYWLYGKYMYGKDIIENDPEHTGDQEALKKQQLKPKTEIKSKAVEEAEILNVNKKAQEDYMLTHNFEKVETAEEFSGVWRGFDGDDSLEEDQEALKELNLRHLVRTDEVAESIYQADFRDLDHIPVSADTDEKGICISYDEWNYKKNNYKTDYCKVYIKRLQKGDTSYAQKCIAENGKILNDLRRKFSQINQKRKDVKRLPQGESIDIDALVDWYTDIHSGRTPSENIYFSKRKKESDLAILFLLDLSLSTDSYADGNRVLDVEKQAVILFGEVLTEYDVDFAIGGFYSKTRNNCSYVPFKGFGDNWSRAKRNLGIIQPEGYTRIGPALRHAKTLVENHKAQNKWVILLSDGKPNDYDQYEGKYGIADVKQALREMHARHINTYAIAIESLARYYLPQMFGHNHYNILSHSDMLVQSLANLYRRIQNK